MMRRKKLLVVMMTLLALMALATYSGVTSSRYVDDEQSTNDSLGIQWGLLILDDGFEGSPWDGYWDESGTTAWVQSSARAYAGSFSALSDSTNNGYFTTDEIDSSATANISISFWYYPNNLEAGDVLVQTYNGTAYNTWYDITNHPNYTSDVWNLFNETISASEYFLAGFRLRFDSTAIGTGEYIHIDDVYITTDTIPPAAPTGLTATAGELQVSLDWNDNLESDLWGYNVYRSLSSGNYTAALNPSPVASSNYTDTSVTAGTLYYYVVRAVDLAAQESVNSNEDSVTPYDNPPAVPTGLTATAGDRLVDLDWTDNIESDLDGYNVYRSLTSGGPWGTAINGSLLSSSNYTDTGLTPGTTYYYVVRAVDLAAQESPNSDEDSAVPVDGAPAAPTSLVATAGDWQVGLDWADNSEGDLDGYNIYRSLSSGNYTAALNPSLLSSSNYTDFSVSANTTYYYVVRAVDQGSNESGNSNEDSATPYDNPPAAPTSLTAAPGDRQVDLNWDNNSEGDLDGYNIYRSLSSGSYTTPLNPSPLSSSDYIDTDLTPLTTYYYVVRAVDLAAQESPNSDEDSAIPIDGTPAAPTGLTATAGDWQVGLDWAVNSEGDLDGYNVYRSLSSGNYTTALNPSLLSSSNYTDFSVSANTTYYYVVRAVDQAAQESGNSNEYSAMPYDDPPAAPTSLMATAGDLQVSLDWADNVVDSDLDGYNVYRRLSSGNYTAALNPSLLSSSNYTDFSVSANTTYYYVVRAVDLAAQESVNSNEDSAMPYDDPPAAPISLMATAGELQVSLDWADNSEGDLDGYNVYRSLTSGNYTAALNPSLLSSSNYTDTTISAGTLYYYVVRAVDLAAQESGNSNEDSATPYDNPPADPTGLTATPGDWQISLDWNDNLESDLWGYNVYRSLTSGNYTAALNPSLLSSSNYTDTSVSANTTYFYIVQAVDLEAQESGDSNEDSAMPLDNPPADPTGLTATESDQQVALDWADNSESDLDGYNVYRSLSSGNYTAALNPSPISTSNYTDTGLTNGTTYYYVVRAVDLGANESGDSNEASATPNAPPAMPANLASTPGDRLVDLNWDDNAEGDLDGYNVYRSLNSGGPWGTPVNGSLVSTSNYTDTGLTNNTTYYYVVTAVDLSSQESGNSNEVSATPDGTPVILLSDGFEDVPWDNLWDDNGTTTWEQSTANIYSGTNSAYTGRNLSGYLTTDNLTTSSAYEMTVSFWFNGKGLETGDVLVQRYNGTDYITWYDITAYPAYANNTWVQFSEVIEVIDDSQYFKADFRLRFDSSAAIQANDRFYLDDVLITIKEP